jgi:5-formyltetrahydrofolate cyclo-ligase
MPDPTVPLRKAALRGAVRRSRRERSPQQAAQQSLAVAARLRRLLTGAQDVALFWPMTARREVDLRDLCRQLWSAGVAVHLPYMDRRPEGAWAEGLRRVLSEQQLVPGERGFLQPAATCIETQQLDWIVVPALLVTDRGERLGYGAGFYDRVVRRFCPPAKSVAVAFASELVEALPTEAHDRPCDWVITPTLFQEAAKPASRG